MSLFCLLDMNHARTFNSQVITTCNNWSVLSGIQIHTKAALRPATILSLYILWLMPVKLNTFLVSGFTLLPKHIHYRT